MSLALANLCVALFLTGVIWIVQVVHYPLFAAVGREGWAAYEASHRTRITFVVAVPMLISVALAAWLLADGEGSSGLRVANAALALAPFVVTFALAVPRHEELTRAWDDRAHARLVAVNWLRTIGWTAQAAVAVALVGSLA